MMKLECTTTSSLRPDLLRKTYSSFSQSLVDVCLKKEGHLYINIDRYPVFPETQTFNLTNSVLNVAREYFRTVTYRIGEGSFAKAARWTLSQPKEKFFFNLEDDWFFQGKLSIKECINAMKAKPQWGRGNVLQCVVGRGRGPNRCHFPPSLFNNQCLKKLLKDHPIPDEADPELWLINLKRIKKLNYHVAFGCGHPGLICRDLGRAWKRREKLRKYKEIYL